MNNLLGFVKESVSQSGHGLILQGEVNNVFKHFDLTAGGAGEGAVLKNQLLVKGNILIFKLGKPWRSNLQFGDVEVGSPFVDSDQEAERLVEEGIDDVIAELDHHQIWNHKLI